jgi:hypothetical protein
LRRATGVEALSTPRCMRLTPTRDRGHSMPRGRARSCAQRGEGWCDLPAGSAYGSASSAKQREPAKSRAAASTHMPRSSTCCARRAGGRRSAPCCVKRQARREAARSAPARCCQRLRARARARWESVRERERESDHVGGHVEGGEVACRLCRIAVVHEVEVREARVGHLVAEERAELDGAPDVHVRADMSVRREEELVRIRPARGRRVRRAAR